MSNPWRSFQAGPWQTAVNVRDFIQRNYTPYTGDESFLAPATARTRKLNDQLAQLRAEEQARGGVLSIDTRTVSSPAAYGPGYLDRENELIVGLQTEAPLCRGIHPFGGMNMVRKACRAYGYALDPQVEQEFQYRTTHNDGVFRVYTDEIRQLRHCGLITGLPDGYGRGRIIGDYRRVALYGVDFLIQRKAAGQGRRRPPRTDRGQHPPIRGAVPADQFPGKDEGDGRRVRHRHLRTGRQCPRGHSVDLLRLPGRHQRAGRRRHEPRPGQHLPGYLSGARPAGGHADRVPGAGADGRFCASSSAWRVMLRTPEYNELFAGRSHVDYRGAGRHGYGRPHAGHPQHLPHAAHAVQPRALRRAEPDRSLVPPAARRLPALLPPGSAATPTPSSTRTTT